MGAAQFQVERGTIADVRALARFHYVSARGNGRQSGGPGVPVLVLRAMERMGERRELVGVLVVSCPALNDGWRERAWPGVFGGLDGRGLVGRERAAAINAHVRTISRVVVEPRRRSMGVGSMLVRAYLGARLTALAETIAAMGRFTSVFERAGMRRVECARPMRDYRLLDALEYGGRMPLDLVDPERAAAVMREAFMREEVDRWLNAARGTRGGLELSRVERAGIAGRALIARPVVYVHGDEREVRDGEAGRAGGCGAAA